MAQRLRCPGGRPSVSYYWVKGRYIIGYKNQQQATAKNQHSHKPNHVADSQRVRGGRVKGGLFLGQSIKG